ncbi:MAG: hypothetical protein Q8R37_04060 [Nanoarchaeota archaeon]|nr:hypothetical protein [Nanoarchaeota archaeon]
MELEGKLTEIKEIICKGTSISTKLVISESKAEKKHTIEFPGLVLADSIGHEIKYTEQRYSHWSDRHLTNIYTWKHCLVDLKINRTYIATK